MKTENIEIFEGERAARYDRFIQIWIPHYAILPVQVTALLHAYHHRDASIDILVAGCGTGMEMKALLEGSTAWKVTGTDPSPEMVAQARQKLSGVPSERYQLIESTIADLPGSSTFNAATSILVMHFLPDDGAKLRFLQSIASRLKPGSPLVLVDMFREAATFERYLDFLEKHLLLAGIDEEGITEGLNHIRNDIHAVPERRVISLLQEAGFSNILRFNHHLIYGGWVAERI